MTDHDWVRRLLAEEGRADEPVPAEVADRLDRVLADLEAQRRDAVGPGRAPVVVMTPRRHRRWGAALLAAAAVTVGGYTVTATGMLDQVGGAESATAGDAGADSAASEEQAPEAASDGRGADEEAVPTAVPSFSTSTFRGDAVRLVRRLASDPTSEGDLATLRRGGRGNLQDCALPPTALRGSRVAVRYDGEPATAVVGRRDGGRVVVQVWSCASPVRLARVTLPATGR